MACLITCAPPHLRRRKAPAPIAEICGETHATDEKTRLRDREGRLEDAAKRKMLRPSREMAVAGQSCNVANLLIKWGLLFASNVALKQKRRSCRKRIKAQPL